MPNRRNCEADIRIAADSTIFLMVNLLIALSLGVHREQFEQRIGFTCPLPFLLRPLSTNISEYEALVICGETYLDARFLTIVTFQARNCP